MSLAEKLAAIRASTADRAPPEALETMHRATEELRESGLADRVLAPGSPLPEFALRNQRDEEVRSSSLHEDGPAVVCFYRGLW